MSNKIGSPKELRQICPKVPEGLGIEDIVEFAVIRRRSIYLTWVLLHTPITANQ
jgi:hypothetical protein